MRRASFALAVPCLVGLLRISYTSSGWSQLEGESLSTVYFILQAKAEIPQQQQFQRLSGRHLGVTLRGNEFLRVPENAATSSPEPLPMHPRNLVRRMNGPARAHTVPEAPRGRGHAAYVLLLFICHPTNPDESNQTFIPHDDTVLLPGRMHPEHKPTVAFVIKIQPKTSYAIQIC